MQRIVLAGFLAACGGSSQEPLANTAAPAQPTSEIAKLVGALRSDTIEVATMRPPGARTALLERRVLVVNPPAARRLAELGDPAVLDALVPLLDDPTRAWAAEVLLERLARVDEKQVDIYVRDPAEWWRTLGAGARARWQRWLDAHRGKLVWDADEGAFVTP
jgi:hypothetical protein